MATRSDNESRRFGRMYRKQQEAKRAVRLLGLIERHGWNIARLAGGVKVFTWADTDGGHDAPTLIEALTQASRCPRCTGGET